MTPVSVLLVAIGGYGQHYFNALRGLVEGPKAPACRLAGVVDPVARQSPVWPAVETLRVPVCATIDEFYAAGHHADLTVVSSPIHWHVPQSLVALRNGSNVLCDKPLCGSVEEATALRRFLEASRRWMMVGYQWSFSAGIQSLKRDILDGAFGAPHRATSLCCWPRDYAYYRRNDWAGRLLHRPSGRQVLDSPANNAMAHFLHNLFFLLGPRQDRSARPLSVEAEMYRAYDIESADTTACRADTDAGAQVVFVASHVTASSISPRFRIECDRAVITCGEGDAGITANLRDGGVRRYPAPDETPQFHKLRVAIELCGEMAPPSPEAVICGAEAALPHTLCVHGMHASVPVIPSFPGSLVNRELPDRLFVAGLDEVTLHCWKHSCLPAETGVAWAQRAERIPISDHLANA